MNTTHAPKELDTPYELSKEQIEQFKADGYIKLKNVFSKETLEHYRSTITDLVKKLNEDNRPVEEKTTYGKAFLQVPNLWTEDEKVKEFCFSKRLAKIASELLEVSGVRMYHDQALYKEASGGYTPWHVDQAYWPLATEKTVTAWIPLHEVVIENGPLSFSRGSHKIKENRDLTIGDESQAKIDKQMKLSDFEIDESPFDLGEVSFHYGYTFHRAGPNKLDHPREVMTVIYMEKDMHLMDKVEKAHQVTDWNSWCPGAVEGEQIDTPLNPILYEA